MKHAEEDKDIIKRVKKLHHDQLKYYSLEEHHEKALIFASSTIFKECSERIRTLLCSDTIKNRIIISGIEILIKTLQVNFPMLMEFFELKETNLVNNIAELILIKCSSTIDAIAPIGSLTEVFNIIRLHNAVKDDGEFECLVENLKQQIYPLSNESIITIRNRNP